MRAAAIAQDGGGDSDDGAAGSSNMQVAPVQQRASFQSRGERPPYCPRCKKTGHRHFQCKLPDTRACYYCEKVGHLAADCQERAKKKASAPADAQPKNE